MEYPIIGRESTARKLNAPIRFWFNKIETKLVPKKRIGKSEKSNHFVSLLSSDLITESHDVVSLNEHILEMTPSVVFSFSSITKTLTKKPTNDKTIFKTKETLNFWYCMSNTAIKRIPSNKCLLLKKSFFSVTLTLFGSMATTTPSQSFKKSLLEINLFLSFSTRIPSLDWLIKTISLLKKAKKEAGNASNCSFGTWAAIFSIPNKSKVSVTAYKLG